MRFISQSNHEADTTKVFAFLEQLADFKKRKGHTLRKWKKNWLS